jgi:CHAT domain-containing protein
MSRRIAICLGIMVAALTAYPGWAEKKSGAVPAVAPAQESASPAQTGEGGEAAELIRKAQDLMKTGKFEEALPLAQQALEIREKKLGPDHPGTAGSLMLVARIQDAQFLYYKALPLYQRALKIREKALGPEHPATAASMAMLARIYSILGFFDKGLPLAQQSLKIREKVLGPENPDTAHSLLILGFLYGQMGLHDKGLSLVQQALKITEKTLGPDHPQTAAALDNLVVLYTNQGLYDQALPLAQRAVGIREKVFGLDHRRTAMSLKNLGFLYLAKKDYGQAEACFSRAKHKQGDQGMVALYLATGQYESALNRSSTLAPAAWSRPQYQAQFYTQKGLALKGLGRRQEACATLLQAINTIEELRARTPGERTSFFETGILSGYFQAYRGMVEILAEMAQKGDPMPPGLQIHGPDPGAAAFYFAESIKARSLLEAMAAGAAPVSSPLSPDLAAKESSLRERLESLEAQREEKMQERGRRDRIDQPVEEFKLKIAALLREQQQLVEEMRRRHPRYAALRYPQPYKARELPLKPGEVLLEYALGEKESYLFRVEPGGKTQVFRLAMGQEAMEKRLGALLAPFRQSVMRREDLSRFSVTEAAGLYRELLEPALAGVSPGTRLIIVPDGVLGAFPFEALVVEAKGDWGKSVLVGDRWPVTYSQSAAILALNRHLGASRASQALFAVGDCIYDKGSPRYQAYKAQQGQAGELRHLGPEAALTMAAGGSRGGQLKFPPLPQTRQTVIDLAALFQEKPQPPQVLLDVLATETKVRQTPLHQYRYLFFGTHGFLADNLAGVREPTLVLTQVDNKAPDNGFLTFSKVLQLKLDADLVTLAACMTGVGQVMQGEGVMNFARAFQQAGARSVTVTLWNIPVEESLKFYLVLYKSLKEGKSRIEAIKAARQAVRAKESHPYFWSGLILHGEG